LTAIGDARDRGARALEAFSYRYPDGESNFERFHVHRTIFPADFLADFGFLSVRTQGRVELARLEFGGLQPVTEGKRETVLAAARYGSCRRSSLLAANRLASPEAIDAPSSAARATVNTASARSTSSGSVRRDSAVEICVSGITAIGSAGKSSATRATWASHVRQ